MNITNILLIAFLIYCSLSVYYVFALRGSTRYEDFKEYLRKGWMIFAPFNCFLYIFTQKRAAKPIMNMEDFGELKIIQDNWQEIQKEALELKKSGFFDKTNNPDNAAFYDLGFRTFFKYGWSKFYLNWYGHTHRSAAKLCPKTTEILSQVPQVKGAMFSLLPVGSKLTRHLDPAASSLRYHLGLETPNQDSCFINVDGQSYSWRDGEAFIFDETYLHFANNNSDKDRLILMCDIDRPLGIIGKPFNAFYQFLLGFTVVPNVEGDKKGLVNLIFSSITPMMKKVRTLKETNMALYKLVKYSVNLSVLGMLVFVLYIGLQLISKLIA